MELGVFGISLTVKDLEASRCFYEKLGFSVFMGDAAQNWLILKNGDHIIGLFQDMFEKNIITFRPASFIVEDPDGNTILVDQHV